MSVVFLKVLNMSINASWLILVVVVARFLRDRIGEENVNMRKIRRS